MSDDNVQAVLVNIFAGKTVTGLRGCYSSIAEVQVNVQLSSAWQANVEEGQKILANSGLPIIRAKTLMEAAERSVQP